MTNVVYFRSLPFKLGMIATGTQEDFDSLRAAPEGFFVRCLGQNQDEFVSAVAAEDLIAPGFLADQLGEDFNDLVSGMMAESVVDVFQSGTV